MSAIILPQIKSVRLVGYAPLFDKTVEFVIPEKSGPFLIVGGNGLGKTSILQSIVFAIAGIADHGLQDTRENSRFKWDISYFKERVNTPRNAEVIVGFSLGSTFIEVRRGLDSERVRGVRIQNGEWENSGKATELYEKTVVQASRCNSLRDFRYLVHRLCYLPESRRNVVWDPDAQLTLYLLVCAEPGVETSVRYKLTKWREVYVEMRHTHTSIHNIKTRIANADKESERKHTHLTLKKNTRIEATAERFDELQSAHRRIAGELTAINATIVSRSRMLQAVSEEIEKGETQLADAEEQFVLHALRDIERGDHALALQKMLVLQQCPYCTQVATDLADKANDRVSSGLCPLCGLEHVSASHPLDLSNLKNALAKKIAARASLQREIDSAHETLRRLQSTGFEIEAKLAQASAELPRIRKDETVGLTNDPKELRRMLEAYENEHRRLDQKASRLRAAMEQEYASVEQAQARRYLLIEKQVAKYASEFIGTTCTFTRVSGKQVDKDSPFAFEVLVPNFGKGARTEPQHCSESQAFFLDIAFRMAVIDVIRTLSGAPLTFICETPENALDMAYAENVASMFSRFSDAGCFTLLTANIQQGGVAEPLLKMSGSSADRKKRIYSLLDCANLTDVQKNKRPELEDQLKKLLES